MRRLKTVRRPPIYPNVPSHLPCSSLTHPAAVLTPSIGVLRWIRAKGVAGLLLDYDLGHLVGAILQVVTPPPAASSGHFGLLLLLLHPVAYLGVSGIESSRQRPALFPRAGLGCGRYSGQPGGATAPLKLDCRWPSMARQISFDKAGLRSGESILKRSPKVMTQLL